MAAHGFEPRTLRVWTACSSQLSYAARIGADDQDWTGDLILTKDTLCRLSYISILNWLRGLDLNQRPSGYEPDELPTAPPRGKGLVVRVGFEPTKRNAADLQSAPFSHSGTSPLRQEILYCIKFALSTLFSQLFSHLWKLKRRKTLRRNNQWSWREESNPQPADYKSAALPIELRQRDYLSSITYKTFFVNDFLFHLHAMIFLHIKVPVANSR